MVTIEILKQSQRTRPRNWVVVFGWIFIWFFIAFLLVMLGTVIPSYFLNQETDKIAVDFLGRSYTLTTLLQYMAVPVAVWVIGFFPLVLSQKMGKYRHPYYLLFVPAVIAVVALPFALAFLYLHDFVTQIAEFLDRFIPADVFTLIGSIVNYVVLGLSAWYILICLFAIFYNINYPGKYEDIYYLRKERILSFQSLDDRAAYKKRFYNDYKRGNWESMMDDLHYASLQGFSNEPMREDAYEYLRYINGRNEDHIHGAILDQYKKEGRFSDIRKQYHRNRKLESTIADGAKITIGKPKKPSKPTPKPAPLKEVPPLAPDQNRAKDPTNKYWSPDDI